MVGKATTGSSFSGLAKYLTKDEGRVAWTDARGVLSTDPREVAREMRAAAGQSGRTEKPVYHLTLSFGHSDTLTKAQMQEATCRVLNDLGLAEHQALLVAHRDREHAHVHVMVNRVHPETGTAWETGHDYRRIETSLRTLEKEWNLERVPGHHARDPGAPAPDRSQSRTTAQIRRERETGEPPFPDQVRSRAGAAFREAKSWSDLAGRLELHGYRVEATGRGMVVTDGKRYAKASSVSPDASRFRLEERFGKGLDDYLAERSSPSPSRNARERPMNPMEKKSPEKEDARKPQLLTKDAGKQRYPLERMTAKRPAAGDVQKPSNAEKVTSSKIYRETFGTPALKLSKEERTRQIEAAKQPAASVRAEKTTKDIYQQVFDKPALSRADIEKTRARHAAAGAKTLDPSPSRQAPKPKTPGTERAARVPTSPTGRAATGGKQGLGADAGRSGGGSGQGAHILAAAARPLSNDNAERDAVFRGLEIGIRAGAALASSRSQEAPSGRQERPEHPSISPDDPRVQKLVRTAEAYQEAQKKEHALGSAIREHAGLERKLKSAGELESRTAAYGRAFDKHLSRTYQDPSAAKTHFMKVAVEQGPDAAKRMMRELPERFGPVKEAARSKWMGLATEVDKAPSYRAARTAAEHGWQYAHAKSRLPGPAQTNTWKATLAAKSSEIKSLQRALNGSGSPERLFRSLSKQAGALPVRQINQLQHLLPANTFKLVQQAARKVVEVAKGRGG